MFNEQLSRHSCHIPCQLLPLVGEADYGIVIKPFSHRDRTADFHVLIYVIKGCMEIIEDDTVYELTGGTLFFLKSGVHHYGRKPFAAGTAWYYVHFYCPEPAEGTNAFTGSFPDSGKPYLTPESYQCYLPVPKLLRLPSGNPFPKLLEQLIFLHHTGNSLRASFALWDILLHAAEISKGRAKLPPDSRHIRRILSYLEENYCRNFTSGELESAVGLSYKYAGSLFKAETGMTIKEYQFMLRIGKAVRLLCETELSIAEIASETGFYDTFYFSKIFKREKGVSPLRFRTSYVPGI